MNVVERCARVSVIKGCAWVRVVVRGAQVSAISS